MSNPQTIARDALRKAFTAYLIDMSPAARADLSRALNLCKLAGLNPDTEMKALRGQH